MPAQNVINSLLYGDSSDDGLLKSFSIRLPVTSSASLISLASELRTSPSHLLKLLAIDAIKDAVSAYCQTDSDLGDLGDKYSSTLSDLASDLASTDSQE